jgi:hypothetical protein
MTRCLAGFIGLVFAATGIAGAAELPKNFAEMISAICDSTRTKDGCAKCPAYMGETVPGQALKFDGYVAGSFTAAGADEVLLRFPMSCYGHAAGFSSAVLLRKVSGKWERIAFYHNEMVTGDCRKIPGRAIQKELLLCQCFDWGAGSIEVISLDAKGVIASSQKLVTEWEIPFRELNPKICSTQVAKIDTIGSDAIDISIQTRTFVPSPDCNANEESHKFEKFIAQFTRNGGLFLPTAATRDFLKEHSKRPIR